ncbi:MAG: DUF4230 domain-containing protein [Polyangiaceae bacterium]|nr:DUF4230 domain-containing protein [Polyangiaceae bacterium]
MSPRTQDAPSTKPDPSPSPRPETPHRIPTALYALIGLLATGVVILAVIVLAPPTSAKTTVTVKPTPSLLTAVKDLARLETTEVHVEKVIDLTDRQSRIFGLIEVTDAILLVAVGRATIGVDLGKLREGDVAMDESKTARLRLPKPELLGAALDERATYVYTRETSTLAKRNEGLETQARREAVAAIEKAATTDEVMARAKSQAEKQLTSLLTQLGAKRVEITWR